ncbi:hypothetical protein M408DRAFT_20857 [Serendipita vermifera MAFF 305830]|uniref:DUF6533 domain-containing protein n=1 Tax=Serendipita vermifera MAFF 305830 TaxID=933852 RepID=A0A0C2X018_SERVB|nr:hypothetical protein M408DRAFT_20857 [Serendipita vermifera MAFF 305830]
MSTALQNTMREIIETLTNIQASRYTCGAGMTVMMYDYFLTLGEEVKFLWSGPKRFSLAKLMFIWNRYITVPWIIISNYHLAALRPPISNTLALRVLALYKNDPKVRMGLYIWLGICNAATFTLAGVSMGRFIPFLMYLPLTSTCYTITDPLVPFVYIPPLLAEGGILVMQILNHIQRRKADTSFKSPLLSTLYRDGYLYFGCIMSLRLVAVFLYEFGPGSLWFIANQMDFALSTTLISRFFLQLRSAMDTVRDDTLVMPLSNRGLHKATRSVSFSLPIQSAPEVVSTDEQYMHIQELRRLKAPR